MDVKPNKRGYLFKKLNKPLIDSIVKDIAEGSTQKLAAESHLISERIFYNWIKQGECDLYEDKESLCTYLVQSLANVKKKEVKWCREKAKNAEKGHKGAEWTLEHAYQKDFSANVAIQELAQEVEELKLLIKGNKDGEELDR